MTTETTFLIGAADPILVDAFFENKRASDQLVALTDKYRSSVRALGSPVPEVFATAAAALEAANDEVARKRSILQAALETIVVDIATSMADVKEGARVHLQYPYSDATQGGADEGAEIAMLVKRLSYKWTADQVIIVLKGFRLRKDGTATKTRIEVDLQPGITLTHWG